MPKNKSLHMDPHASRLVGLVTEYSATQGSSSFSCGYWPGMDTARLLLTLEQGLRSIEDYVQDYLEIAYYSDLPDCVLTVGVAKECNTALIRVMAAAPEHSHKMAVTAELGRKKADTTASRSVIAANPELNQYAADHHESSQVTVDHRESSQVTIDRCESSQVTVDLKEPSHVSADRYESSHISADFPESLHVSADLPESNHVSTDLPESLLVSAGHPDSHHITINNPDSSSVTGNLHESSHVSTDRHEASHVSADLPECLHVSADLPESLHTSVDLPESLHVIADHPEPCHVTADHSETCDVLFVTSRDSRSVLQFSSVRDAPLVSVRSAGIPKPTHSSPPVPELIPLSKVLPIMGIAFWCVWAAHTTTEFSASTMMSLEVAAEAAEPPEVVTLTAAFPEAMVPAAVFPEVAAHAAEPPEAAMLTYESLSCFELAVEAIYALPVSCVSVSPRFQSLPWVSAPP